MGDLKDPGWMMLLPLFVFVIAMFVFGLHSGPVIRMLEQITAGIQ